MKKYKPVVLVILDGWGWREEKENNAIASAKKPFFDEMIKKFPHGLLKAHGNAVGLPDDQMGNSEVGHTTIGAGTVIETDLLRINNSIANGEFKNNSAFKELFDFVKTKNSTLHVMGLLSTGGVHSHRDHLYEFIKTAKENRINKIAIHAFTDGRDRPPQEAIEEIRQLKNFLKEISIGKIATISGRYFAMDRDKNWDRIEKAEKAIFEGKGYATKNAEEAVLESYNNGKTDEFIEPIVVLDENRQPTLVSSDDAILFFNFRPDRARELTSGIIKKGIKIATFTEYEKSFNVSIAFPNKDIQKTLAGEIARTGLKQTHIAETEKFAHATYFLNGGREKPYENENDILIKSRDDIKTHDQAPKMRAREITDAAIKEIDANAPDFIFINYANLDMVGHTANVPAIIKAVEVIDSCLKKMVEKIESVGGLAIITADHGNAELNIDENGNPHTAHTTNPVPVIFTDSELKIKERGELKDLAPTVLKLLEIKKPNEMTGESLL